MRCKQWLSALVVLGVLGMAASIVTPSLVRATAENEQRTKPEPVEPDMHEFMEYVFQPTYARLKQAISAERIEDNGWKSIKSDALILAEGGNLLLIRDPDSDPQAWDDHAEGVRDLGGKLYTAARKKDVESAQAHYRNMLKHCNACHDTFAGGEHQLEP